MKRVHKALKLRHHKHTGKLLQHKHTSYRGLLFLLSLTMLVMVLVNQLDATAAYIPVQAGGEYTVTATVPAPMPGSSPTIDSPKDGAVTANNKTTVRGACPVIAPAVVIAIYDNGVLDGSTVCDDSGNYSVSVPLFIGANKLVATVITMTYGTGGSSAPVTVTRAAQLNMAASLQSPPQINPKDIFALIKANGETQWQGSFTGGAAPYKVQINWGDGKITESTVTENSLKTFTHKYATVKVYLITITAIDSAGGTAILKSTAVSPLIKQAVTQDMAETNQLPPFIVFIEKNAVSIYVSAVSSVIFLWYIERGRHVLSVRKIINLIIHFGHPPKLHKR